MSDSGVIMRLPADVARCEARHCSRKDQCLRYLSPPWENDYRQVYMLRLDPDGCEDFIQIEDQHYIRGTSS